MAQQLVTNILINAELGAGFSQIGSTLSQLGRQIDEISTELIGFGKQSLQTYQDYEKNMTELETIWGSNGTFGRNSRELSKAMQEVDEAARSWAANTVFHTDDVSNAMVEAAHAGWDEVTMLAAMPSVMNMALASSTDLSTALNLVLKSMMGLGLDASDPQAVLNWTDEWIYAANRSAGTAEEFGETFLRLGSTMRMAADPEEILALTAVMADMGTVGGAAGTLVRNSMLRLLAPSQTGKAFLDQLGATEEEMEAVRESGMKLAAFEQLQEHGFSVFDEAGQAKPVLQVYSELREALGDISGGYDNILKNQTALGILANVFGARSATGALNVLQGLEKAQDLYEELKAGGAEGLGEYTAGMMSDTLWGQVMTWESKLENLEVRTGEALAGQVEGIMKSLGGIVDNLATLDTGTFNALVAGLETIALAGPGLLLAGGAFKFLAYALTPAGGIGLSLIALTAAAAAVRELEEADFASQFGDMELDAAGMQNYIQQLSGDFNEAFDKVNAFKGALDEAVTSYTEASSTFKSSLLQDMLTDVELTEDSEEYKKLAGLGEAMIKAVSAGIDSNYGASIEGVTQAFGGAAEAAKNPIWNQIISALNEGYEDAKRQAETLGNGLRQALLDAVSNDGQFDADELAKIQSYMDQLNELMARQAEAENYVAQQRILRKAQTLGLDSTTELMKEMQDTVDAQIELAQDEFEREYINTKQGFDIQIKNGQITQEEADKALIALRDQHQQHITELTAAQEQLILDTADALMAGSDLTETWAAMQTLGASFRAAGGYVTPEAKAAYDASVNATDSGRANQYLEQVIGFLGGYDRISEYAQAAQMAGEEGLARRYQNLLDMYDALSGAANEPQVGMTGAGDYGVQPGNYDQLNNLLQGFGTSAQDLYDVMQGFREAGETIQWQDVLEPAMYGALSGLAGGGSEAISDLIAGAVGGQTVAEYGIEQTRAQIEQMRAQIADINEYGIWGRFGGNAYGRMSPEYEQGTVEQIQADIVVRQNELAELYSGSGLEIPVTPYVEGTDAVESLRDQGVEVQVDGDTQSLQATIDGADGQTLLEYVNGDASALSATISDQDGRTLTEYVNGNASGLAAAINAYNGRTITVNIRGRQLFAEGGRATTASVFGEAGPEWAIPEEHSARTASLLAQAAAASGFSWGELLARNGGLNAGGGSGNTLVYSPTIYANDATDVASRLREDKDRLEDWFEERMMLERMEVYA